MELVLLTINTKDIYSKTHTIILDFLFCEPNKMTILIHRYTFELNIECMHITNKLPRG